jgi:alcohol dehydrogenase (NADP+)
MLDSHGYAAAAAHARLEPFKFQRRDAGANDVVLELLFCGICHSDLHFVNNDWGFSQYPLVPGHEIVGRVVSAGSDVSKFKPGDVAAIGCLIDSCRVCAPCQTGDEHFCEQRPTATYNSVERGTALPTYGGYSTNYVVDERFAMKISPKLDLAAAAPLLCAGITTYSPLRHWQVKPGQKVGVVGVGGLGHVGIKLARAMGAHVVAFTTSAAKFEDARRLGAHEVVLSTESAQLHKHAGSFDFILNTVSANHDVNALINLLKRDCTMAMIGMPGEPVAVSSMALTLGRRRLSSSMIGGMRETQEMLDFCAEHNIVADIETIAIQQVNEAYARLLRNDVKYRFVIDLKSLHA